MHASCTCSRLRQSVQAFVVTLIEFGAVYYCPVHPKPPAGLSSGDAASVMQRHVDGLARHGKHVRPLRRGWSCACSSYLMRYKHCSASACSRMATNESLSACPALNGAACLQSVTHHPQRLTDSLAELHEGGYCRVHLHPKRAARAYDIDWKRRILAETNEYVAVNKPWGVQMTHRVDNVRESVVACVTQVFIDTLTTLGMELPLHSPTMHFGVCAKKSRMTLTDFLRLGTCVRAIRTDSMCCPVCRRWGCKRSCGPCTGSTAAPRAWSCWARPRRTRATSRSFWLVEAAKWELPQVRVV
jgi:hypothetical protein